MEEKKALELEDFKKNIKKTLKFKLILFKNNNLI